MLNRDSFSPASYEIGRSWTFQTDGPEPRQSAVPIGRQSIPTRGVEYALAHSLPDKVEAAYWRGDLIEKRKVLMQVWADYCGTAPPAKE